MITHRLFLIEWDDHESQDEWTTVDKAKEGWGTHCNTIGWLIHEDDKAYIVASTLVEDGRTCQVFRILKGTVVAVRRMPLPRKKNANHNNGGAAAVSPTSQPK